MRITQSTVEALAAEASEAGVNTIESINHPGDGRTHYVMSESMTSTYYGAREAAAYILGVLVSVQQYNDHTAVTMLAIREIQPARRTGKVGAAYYAGQRYAHTAKRARRV